MASSRRPSAETRILPVAFSAMSRRPPGANASAVGCSTPEATTASSKPSGSVAAVASGGDVASRKAAALAATT